MRLLRHPRHPCDATMCICRMCDVPPRLFPTPTFQRLCNLAEVQNIHGGAHGALLLPDVPQGGWLP